jgi:thiol-disulfide isomerase/thioredoxin
MTHSQRGFSLPLVIGTVVVVLVFSVGYMYWRQNTLSVTDEANTLPLVGTPIQAPMGTNQPGTATYTGAVLAGTRAALLDFNQADYQVALQSNKLVALYFYANWCPICQAEFPMMQNAFNQLNTDQVIGFRVNFNDNQTDDAERALAREHGVAYQHTKVFVKNGQRILKSPESWDEARYLRELTAVR